MDDGLVLVEGLHAGKKMWKTMDDAIERAVRVCNQGRSVVLVVRKKYYEVQKDYKYISFLKGDTYCMNMQLKRN